VLSRADQDAGAAGAGDLLQRQLGMAACRDRDLSAIARSAEERDRALAAPLLAGSHLGSWALCAPAQKLLPPHPVVNVTLALAIVTLGVAIAAT